jgi:hypothetical protein
MAAEGSQPSDAQHLAGGAQVQVVFVRSGRIQQDDFNQKLVESDQLFLP